MNVLVPVYSKQAHLIPMWWKYWLRAWPDCPYPVIMIISDKDWSTQMIEYLKPNQPPFLLMLSDYILRSVNRRLVRKAAEAIKRTGIGYVRLEPVPPPTWKWHWDADFGRINPESKYVVSLQPTIWKASLLKSTLMPGESPWQVEQLGSQRLNSYREHNLIGTMNPAFDFLNYLHRGKPTIDAEKWVLENP